MSDYFSSEAGYLKNKLGICHSYLVLNCRFLRLFLIRVLIRAALACGVDLCRKEKGPQTLRNGQALFQPPNFPEARCNSMIRFFGALCKINFNHVPVFKMFGLAMNALDSESPCFIAKVIVR